MPHKWKRALKKIALIKIRSQLLLHQCLARGPHGALVLQVAEEEAKKELAHAQAESPSVASSPPRKPKIAARKNAQLRLAGPTGQLGRNAALPAETVNNCVHARARTEKLVQELANRDSGVLIKTAPRKLRLLLAVLWRHNTSTDCARAQMERRRL